MGLVQKWFQWSQIVLAMLLVQVFTTGTQLLWRVILVNGTFVFALMTYRSLITAIFVAPLAFYIERGQEKKFGGLVWFWLFVSALTGITLGMGLFCYGLRDTTSTYATTFSNLIPIVTFVFSIIFRLEKLELHTKVGKVKTIGAILCVAGALATSLYKGKEFHIVHHHIDPHITIKTFDAHYARGTVLLIGSCLSYSLWFIVQVKLLEVFPFKYWGTMLTCIIAGLQSALMGLCLDRRTVTWKLGWNLQLITIIYSGAVATPATFCLSTWAISIQGPTYPSMFNPLTLVLVAFSEALILGEALSIGILLGMVLIILGLYSFLWGKRKESDQRLAQQKVEVEEQRKKINDEHANLQLTT